MNTAPILSAILSYETLLMQSYSKLVILSNGVRTAGINVDGVPLAIYFYRKESDI